jgi:hypothetical protein
MYQIEMTLLAGDFNFIYGKDTEWLVKELAVADCQTNGVSFMFKDPTHGQNRQHFALLGILNSNMAIIGTMDIDSIQSSKIC